MGNGQWAMDNEHDSSACHYLSLYCLALFHDDYCDAEPIRAFSCGLMFHDLHYIIGVPARHANARERSISERLLWTYRIKSQEPLSGADANFDVLVSGRPPGHGFQLYSTVHWLAFRIYSFTGESYFCCSKHYTSSREREGVFTGLIGNTVNFSKVRGRMASWFLPHHQRR